MPNGTLEGTQEIPPRRESRDKIQTVTSSTFSQLIVKGTGPIVVEFMSYGCAHCRVIEPVLQQVAEMLKPKEKIFRVNIAVEQELAASYAIQGTPTFIMFLNGKQVGSVEGPQPTVSSVLTAVTQPFEK
jgi:thioredoxin 1